MIQDPWTPKCPTCGSTEGHETACADWQRRLKMFDRHVGDLVFRYWGPASIGERWMVLESLENMVEALRETLEQETRGEARRRLTRPRPTA
jgi:hypothetical protein